MSLPNDDHVSEDGYLKTTTPPRTSDQASNELVKSVDDLLEFINVKFTKVAAEVFAKMDDMAQRLDDLEASLKAGADTNEAS